MNELSIIVSFVAGFHNITSEQLKSKTRHRKIVIARQQAHYLASRYTDFSLSKIGREIGGKDHATILYSKKTVKNLCETDSKYRERFYVLRDNFLIEVKPHLDVEYNYELLKRQRSDRRFEIQRKHFEKRIAEIYQEAQKILHEGELTLDKSDIMEGYLKRILKRKIQITRGRLQKMKLTP